MPLVIVYDTYQIQFAHYQTREKCYWILFAAWRERATESKRVLMKYYLTNRSNCLRDLKRLFIFVHGEIGAWRENETDRVTWETWDLNVWIYFIFQGKIGDVPFLHIIHWRNFFYIFFDFLIFANLSVTNCVCQDRVENLLFISIMHNILITFTFLVTYPKTFFSFCILFVLNNNKNNGCNGRTEMHRGIEKELIVIMHML